MLRNGLRRFEGRTVTVHQAQGPSLQGVLVGAHRDCLVLIAASSLDDKTDLAGAIVVPRGPGVWCQFATAEPSP